MFSNSHIYRKIGIVILVFSLFYNCQSTDIHTGLESELDNIRFNSEELRLRINSFSLKFAGVVETAADEIINNTQDPEIKENALLWKLNSIPAINEAIFIVEPFAAAIDTWSFCLQMVDFFENGNGKELFGSHQTFAINTSKILETEIRNLVYEGLLDHELTFAEEYIFPWLKKNKINDLSFTRESTINVTAKMISDRKRNLATSVGEIETTVHDLSMKLNIYYDQLPKLASWRLEYLSNKLLKNEKIDSLESNFYSISRSLKKISALTENSEDLIDHSIQSAFQRLDFLSEKLYSDLKVERELILSELSNERKFILEEIDKQRIETLKEIKVISEELAKSASSSANESIDHFFIRLIQLIFFLLIIALIAFLLFRKFLTRQSKN